MSPGKKGNTRLAVSVPAPAPLNRRSFAFRDAIAEMPIAESSFCVSALPQFHDYFPT